MQLRLESVVLMESENICNKQWGTPDVSSFFLLEAIHKARLRALEGRRGSSKSHSSVPE